jgi:glycosyltransferase involved in cell wall biosynthesis
MAASREAEGIVDRDPRHRGCGRGIGQGCHADASTRSPERLRRHSDGRSRCRTEWALDPTQDELRALYGAADLFVSAERRAGWSNTSAEAMACGAALVCTRSGTEDFAENGVTAAVARWPWTWLLARRLAPLLLDPEAWLGRGEEERIAEFTWERTADRIERALVEALARRKR